MADHSTVITDTSQLVDWVAAGPSQSQIGVLAPNTKKSCSIVVISARLRMRAQMVLARCSAPYALISVTKPARLWKRAILLV